MEGVLGFGLGWHAAPYDSGGQLPKVGAGGEFQSQMIRITFANNSVDMIGLFQHPSSISGTTRPLLLLTPDNERSFCTNFSCE